MFNFLKKQVRTNYLVQIIASLIYSLFYFLENKNKIKIFKRSGFWIHETALGKFASTHPTRKAEQYLLNELPYFIKHYKCKAGDVIFDAGAGIGTEIIYFSKLVGPTGKVYALEANPNVYKYLLQTIKINNLKNVIPINLAVFSQSEKKVNFSSNTTDWLGGKINSDVGDIFVNTITFDDIIERFKISNINFAKFNIEGAEKYLINGKQKFIKNCENVCISCHDFLENEYDLHTYEDIKSMLHSNQLNLLEDNKNIKNLQKDKYFYIYASKSYDTEKKYYVDLPVDVNKFYLKFIEKK